MRPKPIVGALAGVLIVAGTAMLAAPIQQTTQQPGQMTQAHVWVQNRGRSEAVPVDLRDSNLDTGIVFPATGDGTTFLLKRPR
jgi:hypothetical protein